MLSVEECKKYLGNNVPDERIEVVRDALYMLIGQVLDAYLDGRSGITFKGITDLPITSNHGSIKEKL